MRFGYCAPIENIEIIAAIGYDYIEPTIVNTLKPESPSEEVMPQLQQIIAKHPGFIYAYNVFLPGDLKLTGETVDKKRIESYVKSACERMEALNGKVVVFGSAGARNVPDGFSMLSAKDQIFNFLNICAPLAARHGVTVVIEPLNKGESNILNSVSEAVAVAEQLNQQSIRVLSDLYHVSTENQSYEETRQSGQLLRHVHIAGAEGRRVPIKDDRDFLIPYFRVLKEMDYNGCISVEGMSSNFEADARESFDVIHEAWKLA